MAAMNWLAVVPLKPRGERKSRLAAELDPTARDDLAEAMFRHVIAVVGSLPDVTALVLSPQRPDGWGGLWRADEDELNAMLGRLRGEQPARGFAVINADLPLLSPEDIVALLALAGDTHIAIAPDRHGTGTNAVALAPGRQIRFHFGAESRAGFQAEAGAWGRVLHRTGLASDVDCPADLALVRDLANSGNGAEGGTLPPGLIGWGAR